MKKLYEKPEVELINFMLREAVTTDEEVPDIDVTFSSEEW